MGQGTDRIKIVVITGPTAVGKTEYAIRTAMRLDTQIVSADSMQIYESMDIGSAKPSQRELSLVKHHLVGVISPDEEFSVFDYQKLAIKAIRDIAALGKVPVVCGGTGLYINSIVYDMDFSTTFADRDFREQLKREALENGNAFLHEKLQRLDPKAAQRIHPNNVKKVIRAIEIITDSGGSTREFSQSFVQNPDFDITMIGLLRDRKELYERIERRVDMLMENGLVDEVKSLFYSGQRRDCISMKGIGYKEIIGYLDGAYDLDTAVEAVKKNTRNFAKRQMTWFRRFKDMNWINLSEYGDEEHALNAIFAVLKKEGIIDDEQQAD